MDSLVRILLSMIKSGEDKNYDHLGHVTRVPNYGANQYDYISFIIDQYDNLPEMSYFIKGNLFQEYGTEFLMKTTIHQEKDSLKCWTLKNFSAVGKTNNY